MKTAFVLLVVAIALVAGEVPTLLKLRNCFKERLHAWQARRNEPVPQQTTVKVGEIDYAAETARVTTQCAIANNVTAAEVDQMLAVHNKSDNFIPSEGIKCTSRCVIQHSGIIVNGDLNEDKYVAVGTPFGKDPAVLRATLAKCRVYFNPAGDCDLYWKLYACFKDSQI